MCAAVPSSPARRSSEQGQIRSQTARQVAKVTYFSRRIPYSISPRASGVLSSKTEGKSANPDDYRAKNTDENAELRGIFALATARQPLLQCTNGTV